MAQPPPAGRLHPGAPVPPMVAVLGDGSTWATSQLEPEALSLVAVYRGGWCADCRRFISELDAKVPQFQALGLQCVALSVDPPEEVARTASAWNLSHLLLGGNVDRDQGRKWGLYASDLHMHGADRACLEPGLFLLRPDHSLYALWLQSLPSARPDIGWLLETLTYLAGSGFPLRGAD